VDRERTSSSFLIDSPSPVRVALAEDDRELRETIAASLRERGIEVLEATDGASLLAIVRRTAIDLVITDLWMPSLSGSDVVVTRRREGDQTPVILITAAPPHASEHVVAIEHVTILRKPFTEDDLLGLIQRALVGQPSINR
jgi:DNA-binding response OmpR family regulator